MAERTLPRNFVFYRFYLKVAKVKDCYCAALLAYDHNASYITI